MNDFPEISLAPMEGLTGYVYRRAVFSLFGGIDSFYTPFLSNKGLSRKEKNDVLPENNRGMKVIPQFLTNSSEIFLSLEKRMKEYGYTEVNLNLGCPSATVVTKKKGAGFLSDPEALERFFDEIFEKRTLEISVKTRIGMEKAEEWPELLQVFNEFPIKELIVHPRFLTDYYKGKPHMDAYHFCTEHYRGKLCYNGDLKEPADVERLLCAEPATNHIMIGRGILRDPALPLKIRGENRDSFERMKAFEEALLEGFSGELSSEQDVLFRMKELWTYFADSFDASERDRKSIRKTESFREFRVLTDRIIREFYRDSQT